MSSKTTKYHGVNGLILLIELSSKKIEQLRVPDKWRKEYLGGKGLGLRYLYEILPPDTHPLSPENVLIVIIQ